MISLFFFYRIYENKHESKAKRLKDCVTYTIVIGIFYFRHCFFGGLSRRKDNLWALKARLLILAICSFHQFPVLYIAQRCATKALLFIGGHPVYPFALCTFLSLLVFRFEGRTMPVSTGKLFLYCMFQKEREKPEITLNLG